MLKRKLNIKLGLFAIIFILAISFFSINWYLINQFREQLNSHVKTIANVYHDKLTNDTLDSKYLLETILPLIDELDIPIIITTKQSNNNIAYEYLNIEISDFNNQIEYNEHMLSLVNSMDKINSPLPVIIINEEPIIKIHYGDPLIIKTIIWVPYIQLCFAIFVLLLVFIGLRLILSNEKNYIYAGMSRETAHQLGTPISSLLGWLELMENEKTDKAEMIDLMKNDVQRLKVISDKFNKIGSIPSLVKIDLVSILNEIINYYRNKIPNSSDTKIKFNTQENIYINGDEVLLNWAFENIIKNSLEAITNNKKGVINITIEKNDDSVQIYFSDNGQGIIRKNKKRIFNPGFSTKNRGWGIGLNLSKRIIEHIHNGKLQLHKSKIGETVFKIVLKLSIT